LTNHELQGRLNFMIQRTLQKKINELSGYYPAVVVTGPRQSGKTTLCRMTFPEKPYVSLESLDSRNFAIEDPRGFLAEYADGAIIDEIQQAPDLLSYLQGDIDLRPDTGRFILTGSQHFGLSQSISQSLAGRCGVLVLLPPGIEELHEFDNAPRDLFSTLWQGAYPRIYDQNIPAHQWLADYTTTYVQRDARQVINIGDLHTFSGFMKLCAGRTAQEINLAALGSDVGVSHNTIRAWLSVLETSFIVHRLPAWHINIRKQVVKAPKLHFLTAAWPATCWASSSRSSSGTIRCGARSLKAGFFRKFSNHICTTGCSRICFTTGRAGALKSI
jgi:predicted AAA+ superfamily ATPase